MNNDDIEAALFTEESAPAVPILGGDCTPNEWNTIHTYTRAQAIEDGILVDINGVEDKDIAKMPREAGFTVPVAMTTTAFSKYVHPIDGELPVGQDLAGRLWDILTMLRFAIKQSAPGCSTLLFKFYCVPNEGGKAVESELKSVIGPGDKGEPVITIMMPDED